MRFNKYYNPERFNMNELEYINHLINLYNNLIKSQRITEREGEFILIKKLKEKFDWSQVFEIYTNI